jgi:hypothetical protein
MKKQLLTLIGVTAVLGMAALSAQVPGATPPSSVDAAKSWTNSRTPWGDPDLQGIWSGGYQDTPMERPKQFEGREFLTDAEVKAERDRIRAGGDHSIGGNASTKPKEGDTGAYNTVFSGRGRDVIRTRRTSYVIDPPDGQIPYKPEAAERARAQRKNTRTGVLSEIFEDNERGGDGPEDRPNDRCLGFALPHQFAHAEAGGSHSRIVQTQGAVSIYYEYGPHGGAYRYIPLGNRPHLPPSVRQWLGDPVGRWEGDTLVVDTTNFTNRTNYYGAGENLHLIERFTRTGPDLIIYHATLEDPTTFTRPWTIEVPFTKKDDKANQIYETACHEGNYSLTGILAGARLREKEAAAKKK